MNHKQIAVWRFHIKYNSYNNINSAYNNINSVYNNVNQVYNNINTVYNNINTVYKYSTIIIMYDVLKNGAPQSNGKPASNETTFSKGFTSKVQVHYETREGSGKIGKDFELTQGSLVSFHSHKLTFYIPLYNILQSRHVFKIFYKFTTSRKY